MANARGKYILWTDDDVTVGHNWMSAYLMAFSQFPDAAFFGGKITPILEEPAPQWFRDNLRGPLRLVVAWRDLGPLQQPFSLGGQLPYGANYAIRTAAQNATPYDSALGVAPGRLRVGEETAVFEALLKLGAKGYWVPDAEVFHHIGLSRQTERYVKQYFCAQGETWASAYPHSDAGPILVASRWLWRRARVVGCFIAFFLSRIFLPSPIWVARLAKFGIATGALRYSRDHARTDKSLKEG